MKKILVLVAALLPILAAAAPKSFTLNSPNGRIVATIERGKTITYSLAFDGKPVLDPSAVAMDLKDADDFNGKAKFQKAITASEDELIPTVAYKRAVVRNHYNALTLRYKTFDLELRAYDTGLAYRFVSRLDKPVTVEDERAEFVFADDVKTTVSYVRESTPEDNQWFNSFESRYAEHPVSAWHKNRLAFLPVAFQTASGARVCITESDLLNYPGMYLGADDGTALEGVWAPYPKEEVQGGHNQLQGIVKSREDFIAKVGANEAFPWRIVAVVPEDKDLLDNDLVFCLSRPAAQEDWSWVKPGKVAWDWWNAWNIYGVDFKAGINNDTYKYYIDFASQYGIEYVILDEGWAVNKQADLFQVVPEIDLQELVNYGKERNVGLVLWAGYAAIDKDMERVCQHYSEMGIKGFKVDFMDRDDQKVVDFYYRMAATAAKYHLFIDFHGAYKPTGLSRTYPNVLNYEGVYGLEQAKWDNESDLVTNEVTIPFIRMVAGPMDYTQGAMKNANKNNFKAVYTEPMSQGTRCRQLAEYVIFEAPFNMLCDSPSNYLKEDECTQFIANVPTTWDETIVLDGKVGEYLVIARRKDFRWYIGAITNWEERDIKIDLSVLPNFSAKSGHIFRDGPNANRVAKDYVSETAQVMGNQLKVHLAKGGGMVVVF